MLTRAAAVSAACRRSPLLSVPLSRSVSSSVSSLYGYKHHHHIQHRHHPSHSHGHGPSETTTASGLSSADILALSSTPAAAPSYPRGPYTFYNRQYFIIVYESCPIAIRKRVPEPLVPAPGNLVRITTHTRTRRDTWLSMREEKLMLLLSSVVACII